MNAALRTKSSVSHTFQVLRIRAPFEISSEIILSAWYG